MSATALPVGWVGLFGSYARGEATIGSDLDVAIVASCGTDDAVIFWHRRHARWKEALENLLDIKVQLELAEPHQDVVWPVVQRDGILLYRKAVRARRADDD